MAADKLAWFRCQLSRLGVGPLDVSIPVLEKHYDLRSETPKGRSIPETRTVHKGRKLHSNQGTAIILLSELANYPQRVIRTEEQFVWNFTALMVFLAVGLALGLIAIFTTNGLLESLGGVFIHTGGGHILSNIFLIMLVGLGLSAFAHPVEFVGILISATVIHAAMRAYAFSGVGLSLVVYAAVGALIVYLLGVVFELKHFGSAEKFILVVTAGLILLTVFHLVSDQLLHDLAVVIAGHEVQFDARGYTRESSFGHVFGFVWGLVAGIGLRVLRYRVLRDFVPDPSVER